MSVRFDLEVREDFIGDGKSQWVIEHDGEKRIEHGPMESWADAKKLIARRKDEIAKKLKQ